MQFSQFGTIRIAEKWYVCAKNIDIARNILPLERPKNSFFRKKCTFLRKECYKSAFRTFILLKNAKIRMSKDILLTVFTHLRTNFMRQAQRILASEEDAEDVVQDAFCKLWRSNYSVKTENEAEALARTTIRNLSLDERRKQDVRPQFTLDPERDAALQRSAMEEMDIRERFEQVEAIIETELSPSEQRVMQLREYDERSFDEIAHIMGISEAAVRMKLSRARKKIRTIYIEQNKKEGGTHDD